MISAILLGAGESKRMGSDKLALPWGRKTVLESCFQALLQSQVREVVIVQGIRNKVLRDNFQDKRIRIVRNLHPEEGMSSSIRQGLRAVRPESEGILIALGDQPFLKTRTINALIRAFDRARERIVVPSFQGRTGHPVIFHKVYKKELMNLKGDVGGRSIIERHPEDVRVVKVKSIGVVKDLDTWQDYEKSREKVGVKKRMRKDPNGHNKENQ